MLTNQAQQLLEELQITGQITALGETLRLVLQTHRTRLQAEAAARVAQDRYDTWMAYRYVDGSITGKTADIRAAECLVLVDQSDAAQDLKRQRDELRQHYDDARAQEFAAGETAKTQREQLRAARTIIALYANTDDEEAPHG